MLLRVAGALCLREQLWGKARSYLNESLRIAKQPETLVALARLAEAVGDEARRHSTIARRRSSATPQPLPSVGDGAGPFGAKAPSSAR